MRISAIRIGKWRNLVDVAIDLDDNTDFLCLVGENGSGKSSLVELITYAANHLGLVSQPPVARRPLPETRREPFDVSLTLRVGLAYEILTANTQPTEELRAHVGEWDGTLTFDARGVCGEPRELFEGPYSADTAPNYVHAWRAYAGGITDVPRAVQFARALVAGLARRNEVMHLYLDAERVFPPARVREEELPGLAREDPDAPQWRRNQAALLTQNLYVQWVRALLGEQQRQRDQLYDKGLAARGRGEDSMEPPVEFMGNYAKALQKVLPHLRFVRIDHRQRELIFDSAGVELPYEELSGGERELAFLVGQVERFGMRDGLFLLDEPELHLNSELLRGWLSYLQDAIGAGQAWIATHALEAAEVAGLGSTLVFERDETRRVTSVAPMGTRPALKTLAGQLGSPAFSVARSRFLLIEGERPGRERQRFARLLEAPATDRFIESGGCQEVLRRLDGLRALASEEEQLRVGGLIDRDFRTDQEVSRLETDYGVCVLPVHEVEKLLSRPRLAPIGCHPGWV